MLVKDDAPQDLVLVGYISGAFGLQGWVKVKPYSATADALLSAKYWWLESAHQSGIHSIQRLSSKIHGDEVVARLSGVDDRNAAESLKGTVVKISRADFPALPEGEFYWQDLIGCRVVNVQNEPLGVVRDLMDNGAHPILRIANANVADADLSKHERLIPFVEHFVKDVMLESKTIVVDWGLDF